MTANLVFKGSMCFDVRTFHSLPLVWWERGGGVHNIWLSQFRECNFFGLKLILPRF
jgi:hypothetical protein